ncbi:hypothetical protein UlMin_011690 [Ulmus minor]
MKLLLFLFSFTFSSFPNSFAYDTIKTDQTLNNDQTLISDGGAFEFGFFSLPNSTNRYMGIWFKNVPEITAVWIANRDNPLTDSSGVLTITSKGNIVILSNTNQSSVVIWSSESSAKSPTLQLLNTGNLVVKDGDNGNYAWQSFDQPTDTQLAGMKIGWNLKTGQNWHLTSWLSPQDPSTGNYTYEIEPRGIPQALVKHNDTEVLNRGGSWDGVRFGGDPPLAYNKAYFNKITFVFNTSYVYYTYELSNASIITRFWLNPSGSVDQYVWTGESSGWIKVVISQTDICDNTFSLCGPNGICTANQYPPCHCLTSFVPKVPQDWDNLVTKGGCIQRTPLNCSVDKGFKKFPHMKLPYASEFWVNRMVERKKECEAICSRNCSCLAYAFTRISGCALWFDQNLLDMRVYRDGGQDLYIKLPASELEHEKNDDKRTAVIISVSVISGFLLLFSVGGYVIRRISCSRISQETPINNPNQDHSEDPILLEEELELTSFSLDLIVVATNNFCSINKIGEGGFGLVYKGILSNGQEIAVKRLSKYSEQGLEQFKTEVVLIANLQHRNLVRLLGCCIHREYRMLIYEYMPKKSLDLYIFSQSRSTALVWKKRFDIIVGIARGLLYLHRDSRLRIIHRDLKASNILLDNEMNPKISDFGLARILGADQTEVNTNRVVGTYGYMSPEYAVDGHFSMKSDVFSFGVVILEILSGRKNRGFDHPDHELNLLGHAWKLWNEGRPMELMDKYMENAVASEVLKCIQVGLLCVQKRPEDRPEMTSVIFELHSENPTLLQPKQPGFYIERVSTETDSSSSLYKLYASNQLTVTTFQGR